MRTEIIELNEKVVRFIQYGNRKKAFYFFIMGSFFQVLFIWGYWSFLDATNPFHFIWLTVINMELLPFTTILFIFGAGCYLITFKELTWSEIISFESQLQKNEAGLSKSWKFLFWKRKTEILSSMIINLRIHIIPQDILKLKSYKRLEIDFIDSKESNVKTLLIFSNENDPISNRIENLAKKIQKILNLDKIEYTESLVNIN